MPTYDLKCTNCGHEFTVFCSISDKNKQKCPECGCLTLETLFKSVNPYSNSGSPSSPAGGTGFG